MNSLPPEFKVKYQRENLETIARFSLYKKKNLLSFMRDNIVGRPFHRL